MSTILKPFQQTIVDNGARHITDYLQGLRSLTDPERAQQYKRHAGTLLLEAPTGTGKTLMAGRIAEAVTQRHEVTWLWFAPFAGLIEQTEAVVRSEFPALRVRSLRNDRNAATARAGEVRVATWSLISNENTTVHQPGELGETLEEFIKGVRERGFRIGVVIDEAHHTFQPSSKAFGVYKHLIDPDVTLLLTATPKDRQIERFKEALSLEHVERLAVSRASAVEARLIKRGVQVAVFDTDSTRYEKLIDFQKSALAEAVRVNRRVKDLLEEVEVPFTPLLLVQVDSGEDSVQQARDWLVEFGIPANAIRSHTADEPNPSLLADAHDEEVEALIFKMAVATGFDAPRAFVLASLRNARDVDFGVQVIGRILRVDRRLQALPRLPAALENGYVVLANAEGQKGLLGASERINAITDHLELRPTVVVLPTGDGGDVVPISEGGQPHILTPEPAATASASGPAGSGAGSASSAGRTQPAPTAGTLFGLGDAPTTATAGTASGEGSETGAARTSGTVTVQAPEVFRYPLRADVPKRLETALVSLDQQNILDDVVNAYPFEELLADTRRVQVRVNLRVEEVFSRTLVESRDSQGSLTDRDIDRVAQQHLFNLNRDGAIDPRLLHEALCVGLKREFQRQGWPEADDEQAVRRGLQKLLALHPGRLEEAISRAVAKHTEAQPTQAPLPPDLVSDHQLPGDPRASYKVVPEDLNRWERAFVREIERDPDARVEWWHRNPVRRPYSVAVPIPGQPNFYPDFALKVRGRTQGNGIVLVEIKGQINDFRGNAQEKAQAAHPTYGTVLMLHWHREEEWRHVRYNASNGKNELGAPFDLDHLRTYR